MSDSQEPRGEYRGYQAKTDKPLSHPPKGGSNVAPPPSAKTNVDQSKN